MLFWNHGKVAERMAKRPSKRIYAARRDSAAYRENRKQIRTAQSETKEKHVTDNRHAIPEQACVPSFSGKWGAWLNAYEFGASLTVEAAICLPLVLFLCVLLLQPLRAMGEQRQLQNRMEAAAKDTALAAYIATLSPEQKNPDLKESQRTGKPLLQAVGAGAVTARVLAGHSENALKNLHFTQLKLPQEKEDEMIQLELSYELKLPFSLFRLPPVRMTSVVNRRAWVGAAGGRGRALYGIENRADGFGMDGAGNQLVYVGRNGTRYHRDRHCHYIDNQMQAVPGETIEAQRNASGGKYHPCASCKPAQKGMVYIFSDGTSYHRTQDCKAVGSYAQVYRLEEVAYLGPCSYCSRKTA